MDGKKEDVDLNAYQLNSMDFPPLPERTDANAVMGEIHSQSSTTRPASLRTKTTKRAFREEEDDSKSEAGMLTSPVTPVSTDSLGLSSSSPQKKSRRLEYRDPPPVLLSLDADSFRNLFDAPNLSESQNSDAGIWSQSTSSFSSPKGISTSSNLGSLGLGDVIAKCSNATLDSFRGFEVQYEESDNAEASPLLLSPVSRHREAEGTGVTLRPFSSTRKSNDSNSQLCSDRSSYVSDNAVSVSPTFSSEDRSQIEDDQPSNLMSCSFDITSSAEISQTSSVTIAEVDSELTESVKVVNSSTAMYKCEVEKHDSSPVGKELLRKDTQILDRSQDSKCKNDVKAQERNAEKSIDEGGEKEDTDYDDEEEEEEDSGDEEDSDEFGDVYEADGLENVKCKKNPGHASFHSPDALKVKDLPPEIQHQDSLTYFSCASRLLVQISVYSTSAARGPNDIFSSYIGTNRRRNGSGFIASVDEDIRSYICKKEDCPYAEDANSSLLDNSSLSSPGIDRTLSNMSTASTSSSSSTSSSGSKKGKHRFYSGVYIHTNKHVIFDKSEADNAYVKFFYRTKDGERVVHGHVAAIIGVNNLQDHVTLHVMSHDKTLFNTIGLDLKNAKSSYNQMVASTHKTHEIHGHKHKHSWVAVISHPHGMPVCITLGRIVKEVMDGMRIIKYYNAATCPGSSGGLVITPSLLKLQWPGAVHSCSDKATRLNVTFDSRVQDLDLKEISRINKSLLKQRESYPDSLFML